MNRHSINEKLNKTFESYLKSIKDEKVRNLVRKGTIISGGAIMSMLLDEEINDYVVVINHFESIHQHKAVAILNAGRKLK